MSRPVMSIVFVGLLLASTLFVLLTTAALPERVASHFGPGGQADGFMTRAGYRWFMLFFVVGFPTLLVFAIAGLPRLIPRYTNIPNRDYWLAPAHQAQAFAMLTTSALWFGCLLIVFLCSVHWFVIQANTRQPPHLANGAFLLVLGIFFATLVIWTIHLYRQFRVPTIRSQ